MKLYKLTDERGQTFKHTQWGENITHRGTGQGSLCSAGYIHAYEHPLIALLMNPIHGNFQNPRLWEAEGEVALRNGQLKCGCVELTTLREIPVPEITTEMRVAFAIRVALVVYADPYFSAWANQWLDGSDRSQEAAWTAAEAAWTGVTEAGAAEAAEAAEAAGTAEARAARAAARAARAARAEIDLFELAETICLARGGF